MTINEAIVKFENTVLYESLGVLPKHEENQIALDALKKQLPIKLEYKHGFAHCSCGEEFESEGLTGLMYCSECGQCLER